MDRLLSKERAVQWAESYGRETVKRVLRDVLEEQRLMAAI